MILGWLRKKHLQVTDPDLAKAKTDAPSRARRALQDLTDQRLKFNLERDAYVLPIRTLRPEVLRRNHLADYAAEALIGKEPRTRPS